MTQDTIYIYDNGTQQITFSRAPRQFWITKLSGVSDNAVTVSETQGVGQVGATLGSMSVQPRDITVNGCVFEPVEDNRAALLACVLPGVLARFIVAQAGKAWYLEGTPKKTPDFSDSPVVQDFQFSFHCPYPTGALPRKHPPCWRGFKSSLNFLLIRLECGLSLNTRQARSIGC